eukprot:403336055
MLINTLRHQFSQAQLFAIANQRITLGLLTHQAPFFQKINKQMLVQTQVQNFSTDNSKNENKNPYTFEEDRAEKPYRYPLGSYRIPPKDEMKFSAFARKERDYSVDAVKPVQEIDKPFEPKEEFTRMKFDPDVRSIVPEFENHVLYQWMDGQKAKRDAESSYVAINHKGEVWHLFNAARMPLGRMAAQIAVFVRGKHKPQYTMNRYDLGDRVVVVNASKVMVTGKKKSQKLYRHHTGYVGGLKEIVMEDLIERDPCQIIRRAVKGMLPKNTIREIMLDHNLFIHEGLYHNHIAQKLPQFVEQKPEDINEKINLFRMDKSKLVGIYDSDPLNPPEEFKDVKRDIDNEIDSPFGSIKKTHHISRKQIQSSINVQRSFRHLKKYRQHN